MMRTTSIRGTHDEPAGYDAEVTAQGAIVESAGLVRSEYLEMPGLLLTPQQAQRLWNFDRVTCDLVFDLLTADRFLRRTPGGSFVRADCGAS